MHLSTCTYTALGTPTRRVRGLNEWTTAVGSAVFAVLPGFVEGGRLGETLLD